MSGIDPEIAALWARMKPVALERAERIVAACDGDVDETSAAEDAHKLAGSLGMYGFAEASELAVEVDGLVRAGALGDERVSALRAAAVALRQAIVDTS